MDGHRHDADFVTTQAVRGRLRQLRRKDPFRMSQAAPSLDAATILVAQPEPLRDYFLRLGAEAAIVDPSSVRVELAVAEGDDTIADHLERWVEVNGVDARIATDEPEAEVEPEPVPARAEMFFLERPRLGDLLLKKGLITQQQLEAALTESRETGDLLGRVMIRRQFIFEDELARTLADQLALPYVNLRVAGFDRAAAAMIPSSEGMRIAAVPVGVFGGRIRVAFADPSDETAQAVARKFVGDFSLAVSELSEIELVWRSLDPTVALARTA
jgi:Type II secretion system (T2SS), protein E, N-terminal domain